MIDSTKTKANALSVRLDQVGKCYKTPDGVNWVLRGIDLQVEPGECVFLVGPSGCGKSTLLSIIGCLLSPDEGLVDFGEKVSTNRTTDYSHFRRQFIGFVFQKFQLIQGLSALENVAVSLYLRGRSEREAHEEASHLLDRVGMSAFRARFPNRLSPGQCQRVAIARAVAGNPPLLLADEPTASLDERSGQEAMELFAELRQTSKTTAVVVTHDPRIYRFADRILEVSPNGIQSKRTIGNDRRELVS
jgi:putative ABC transport system ATP-binding protein